MGILNFFGGNVLYYPGCLTKIVAKDLEENYKKILNKIGIDFIMLKDLEVCCGNPVLNSGHEKEARELVEKNFKLFKERAVKKIITNCPACFHMFKSNYPRFIKNWDIKVEHITQTIAKAIKDGKINPKNFNHDITYHDPCHLGRYEKIYEEPREIIKKSGNLKEMKLTKNYSFCCGGGSGVKSNYPELANSIAKERIKMAKETNAKMLCTSCPMCYLNLKENSKEIDVKEISQFFFDEKNNKQKLK
ncbi:MAG: (Fe-S)-binding protein [Candidatus Pacearchaeota archaeon]|nr:(Fe-S)-binding protein [Candidatus Pacearchaeota archaeon]